MNRFVAECLSRDYDVATAFDGREGLEQALRFNPMIVVSDIMMPHVSGVEMVAQMRARPELQHTPILLLSAKADEELMVQLLDHGAQDFIVKPFSERDLLVRSATWCSASRRARPRSCRSACCIPCSCRRRC